MKKSLLFILAGFFLVQNAFSQGAYQMSIYFGAGKYQLHETDLKKLDHAVEVLKSSQSVFRIEGNTSDEGTESSNFSLGEKRIKSVSAYLQSKGVDIGKADTKNWGESRMIYLNTNAAMRALNRRVDILIPVFSGKKEVVRAKDIVRLLEPKVQEFCISNDTDTAIIGEKGSIIHFAKNSFDPDGIENCKCITIKLQELFSNSDIILANASTVTKDGILESKAMLNIKAECHGKELQLAEKKQMAIILTGGDNLDGLGVFYGDYNEKGKLIWGTANNGETINSFNSDNLNPCYVFNRNKIDMRCRLVFCKIFRFLTSKQKKEAERIFVQQVRDSISNCNNVTAEQQALMDKYGINDLAMLRRKIVESATKTGKMDGADADYYILSALRTGYINADWILKIDQEQLTTLKINMSDVTNVKAYLIFNAKRTVIPAYPYVNGMTFGRVPVDYGAKVFAIKDDEKGALWAFQEITIVKDQNLKLDFKPAELSEIQKKLAELNNK